MTNLTMRLKRFAWLCTAAAIMAGCATPDFGGFSRPSDERRALTLAQNGEFAEAASIYIGLASAAAGAERDRLTLLAVEQWLYAGDGRRAKNALSQIPRPAGGDLLWLWSSDVALLALWEGRPDDALRELEPLAQQPLPAGHRARIEALRGDAWFQKGDPLRATDLFLQRENWLDDQRAIDANRKRLWAGLSISNVQALRNAAEVASDPVLRGWLALAALANSTGQQGIGWANGLVQWQQTYADHPAIRVLPDLTLAEDVLLNYPRQIALLLPLSGEQQAAGNAIRNGFLGAYFSAVRGADTDQQIRIYDVGSEGGASQAYSAAVAEGAEFVVGPLLRRGVAELASELLLPVPVLALNYLPDENEAPPGFFQFGLAPEDEAASAAMRAIEDGHRFAIAFVPANDWGRRVLQSFATEFEGLGGTLLEYRNYEPSTQDFSFEIESQMALTQSVQRYQRLRANLGEPLQFDPRPRQDVDFIFLAADAKAGRLIKSQLKFHYSGHLPVYSTSFIHSMDGRSNSDLNGLMFADAPWVVAPPAWIEDYPALYGEFWPAQQRLTRLHAMGYDAYNLVGALFNARERAMDEINGASGRLFLSADGRVHRQLAWARFERGLPVAMPARSGMRDDSEYEDEDDTEDEPMEWLDSDEAL